MDLSVEPKFHFYFTLELIQKRWYSIQDFEKETGTSTRITKLGPKSQPATLNRKPVGDLEWIASRIRMFCSDLVILVRYMEMISKRVLQMIFTSALAVFFGLRRRRFWAISVSFREPILVVFSWVWGAENWWFWGVFGRMF